MNTHCELCGSRYFDDENEAVPLEKGSQFCLDCAIKACEQAKAKDAEIDELKKILAAQANGEGCNLCHCCGERRHEFTEADVVSKDAEIARLRDALEDLAEAGTGTWVEEQARRAREGGK